MRGCVIGGYHGPMVKLTACDTCGIAVCAEHRGLHWERAHGPRRGTTKDGNMG